MLQNPAAGNQALFQTKWLRFIDIRPRTLSVYITCDPASSRKKGSDNTAIVVTGIDAAGNKYLLDGYHHKMGLTERWTRIRDLRKKWMATPGVQLVRVGYERFGLTDALEYFEERMRIENDSFEIVELNWPRDGTAAKYDRIQRMEPDFRNGRWFLAGMFDEETANQRSVRQQGEEFRVFLPTRRMDHDKKVYSLNSHFLEEYRSYPFSKHDDFLDAMSRIYDMDARPPVIIDERDLEPEIFADGV
jgi:phage terminase large subunit-like protein